MSPSVLLRGGQVIGGGHAGPTDVLIDSGKVVALGAGLEAPAGARELDCSGCHIGPGLVDLHAHLREPGDPEAETIESGSRAAALGGYTAVVAMPNTDPAIDSVSQVDFVHRRSAGALCEVVPSAAITIGRAGKELAPLGELAAAGVRIFTDDGSGVQDASLMRRALEYAIPLGITLAQHCEDSSLAAGGHMNEGVWSSRLGIPGAPGLAEEAMVARDIDLVRLTGGRIHFLHLSTARSVELVAAARAEGLRVTAEVAPHHLVLTDDLVQSFDPVFKVNPPLRTQSDVEALRAALAAGIIDAVATDHAPHPPHHKEAPFAEAPPGMLGLETALALTFEVLSDAEATFRVLSTNPAAIAGLDSHGQEVAEGAPANICVFDPSMEWRVEPHALASVARNSPYDGRTMRGRARHTLFRGEAVVIDGEAQR